MTTDCDDPDIGQLEYAPHRVFYDVTDDGKLVASGHNELLDSEWEESGSWFCRGCDTEFESEMLALNHALEAWSPRKLHVILDITDNTGMLWLHHWGEVNDANEPYIVEEYIGVERCEECHELKAAFTLDDAIRSVPVCQNCLADYEWVIEIRGVDE